MSAADDEIIVGQTSWEGYLGLDRALEERGYRVKFFKGVFEIMSISFKHEAIDGNIGRLIEAFCRWAGIDYQIWGSTTQRVEGAAGAEPDESFTFGEEKKTKPDLVIEVGLTSGGIDKVELWKTLGAKEAWVWQNNELHGFARASTDEEFHRIKESLLLPGLRLALVQEFALMEPSSKAVREFSAKLEASRKR